MCDLWGHGDDDHKSLNNEVNYFFHDGFPFIGEARSRFACITKAVVPTKVDCCFPARALSLSGSKGFSQPVFSPQAPLANLPLIKTARAISIRISLLSIFF